MGLRTQKYWLEPEKIDKAVEAAPAAEALATKVTVNAAGLVMVELPETDPEVAGALWNDSGTVKVSAGV